MYSAETTATPSARDSGRLRLGLRTSPAVNVMLFQESDEKSEPTMATPTSLTEVRPQPALRQKSVKLEATASGLRPTRKPAPTSANKVPTLANVKTFCTIAPVRMPLVLLHVRKMMTTMPSSCWVLSPKLPPPIR